VASLLRQRRSGSYEKGDFFNILPVIDSGKERLAQMDGDFTATLERISQ
jgi:hypothetical protein